MTSPSRRIPALAVIALAVIALAGPAVSAGATSAAHSARTTRASSLSELLRRVRGLNRTKAHSSPTVPSGAGTRGSTPPTTTFVPSGGATAPTVTTSPPVTSQTVTSPPAARTAAPGQTAPGQTAAPVATTRTSKPKAASGDRRLSTGAIVIAALATLLVIACLGWALARNRAFEPRALLALRHASAEAGFRASATWSELADWARLGR
ncbi:MAG TPA: hypothetical protein VGX69_07645 [Solirubrobacteraceae bacterium]|nr:hypothetical protein [Solirubrobacteraceae bacterium]